MAWVDIEFSSGVQCGSGCSVTDAAKNTTCKRRSYSRTDSHVAVRSKPKATRSDARCPRNTRCRYRRRAAADAILVGRQCEIGQPWR